ncbi:hypothetical protein [Pyxidicoccus xibeiensis]|uniref:hypothetical protein n=1 Tax=Pyxidicoccus xibeiensis TaxID=2906759 RepID=UPI0020A7F55A|nr:hypothetical protein [Pyxidicoccus xibeiensis]MCP3136387.1 hypothetical protein [Pyxidicoccus xibeiensis]
MALALGAFGSGCRVNSPPEVTVGPRPNSLTADPGEVLMMQLEVNDPDGDDMTYEWAQVPAQPAGRFSDIHARNPTWTAPDVAETSLFNITVTVQDSEGAGVLGTTPSVVVRVPPPAP